jgi:predicted PurR-regulated permease PerM
VRALATLVAVVVLLAALSAAASIVVPLLLALAIAAAFQPMAERLERHGVPALVSSGITVVIVLGVVVGVGALVVLAARDLADSAPHYADQLTALRSRVLAWLDARGLEDLASSVGTVDAGDATPTLVRAALVTISDVVSDLVNVVILVAFIQLEATLLKRKLLLVLGPAEMERTALAVAEVQRYLRIKFLLAAANGLLLGAWCAAWEVDNPVLWGVLAFALNFVPVIGSLLSAIPPLLLALLEGGLGAAVGVGSGYVAVNVLVDNLLEQRLMGRALGLSPLVLMVSLLVWGFVLGPVGALLSVPLTVSVRIFLDHHPQTRWVGLLLANGTRGYEDLRPITGDDGAPAAPPTG